MIQSVPLITKDHILLVQTILSIRWIKREADVVALFHSLILDLMTSNHFLVLCLTKIIECFVPEGLYDSWFAPFSTHLTYLSL